MAKIRSVFGDKATVISDYDDQLKKVMVDGSKFYFATHDGRYLFAGPILDTEKKINIVSLQENQLRQTYLNSLPEDVFVMDQHLKIARDLKITSTPTIVLPNGQLKLGLVSPDQLLRLLEGAD